MRGATLFVQLLPDAGERIARDFVGRLETVCLNLARFPERGTLRDHVRPGLRIIGYRRQASIAFVVTESDVLILRVLRRGAITEVPPAEGGDFGASDDA